jgi:hypothetical protein
MFEFIQHPEYGCRDLKALRSFFLYFLRNSYMQPCGWKYPRAEGHRAHKIVCLILIILVFHFFSPFLFAHRLGHAWLHLQIDRYNMSMKFLNFFKEFYKVHTVQVLNMGPTKIRVQEFKFEPCIWVNSDVHKTHLKKKTHVIYINFGEKKFTIKKTPKKRNLMFECSNLLDPMYRKEFENLK